LIHKKNFEKKILTERKNFESPTIVLMVFVEHSLQHCEQIVKKKKNIPVLDCLRWEAGFLGENEE
jgi:hypothetical protein